MHFEVTKPSTWMKRTPNLSISNLDLAENQWIILNVQQTGEKSIFQLC
jgi:hypothetical protein